jgi:competence protein ComEC
MVIMKQETTDFARETKVAEVSPILDTIQVDGDQVSFVVNQANKFTKFTIR